MLTKVRNYTYEETPQPKQTTKKPSFTVVELNKNTRVSIELGVKAQEIVLHKKNNSSQQTK